MCTDREEKGESVGQQARTGKTESLYSSLASKDGNTESVRQFSSNIANKDRKTKFTAGS